ncbi:MAG: hypothetical protein SGPRY_005020 [Prymnesium sp.]
MYPIGPRGNRQDGMQDFGFGSPFGMMNAHNSMFAQMDQMMNSMMGPGMLSAFPPGRSLGDPLQSMMGTGAGGASYSSCSFSCSSGPGHSVQYSSSSHGVQRPGEEMVHETRRNYQDSSGTEKLGVTRGIGNRGRSIVAERMPDGTETRTDNLLNVTDGTSFDREWGSNAVSQHVTHAHTQARTQLRGAPVSSLGGGMQSLPPARPTQSNADRLAARKGHELYAQQKERLLADARAQRQPQPDTRAQRQRQPQEPAQTLRSRQQVGPSAPSSLLSCTMLDHRPLSRSCSNSGDAQVASRLAQREARRAGLY